LSGDRPPQGQRSQMGYRGGFDWKAPEVPPLKVQFRAANPNQSKGYIDGHRR